MISSVGAVLAVASLALCSGESTLSTGPEEPKGPGPGNPDVAVEPSRATVTVGDTVTFEIVGVDDTTDATVTWESTDTTVAVVDEEGVAEVVGDGEALIAAEIETGETSERDTAELLASPDPVLEEDFSTYGSTSDLLSDPQGIYVAGSNEQDIALDASEGPSGGQSMRYDFPALSQCTEYSITRTMNMVDAVGSGYTEVWIEIRAKFSPNFHTGEPNNGGVGLSGVSGIFESGETVDFSGGLSTSIGGIQTEGTEDEAYLTMSQFSNPEGPAAGETVTGRSSGATATVATEHLGCSKNSDYKWIILNGGQGQGWNRFELKQGKGGVSTTASFPGHDGSRNMRLPTNSADKFNSVEDFFDGEWHTFRMHWALEDPVNSSANNGISRIWVDGVLVQDWRDLDTRDHTSLGNLKLGANRNTPANELMRVWYDRIRVWNEDPGW